MASYSLVPSAPIGFDIDLNDWSLQLIGGIAILGILWKAIMWANKILKHIAFVAEQLRPNGGGSLVDKIDRIDTHIAIQQGATRFALDTIQIPVYECDTDGKCVWVNDALAQLFGLSAEECHGWGWLRAVAQEDRERARDVWVAAVEKALPYDTSYRIVDPISREKVPVRATANPVYGYGDKPIRYFGKVLIGEG